MCFETAKHGKALKQCRVDGISFAKQAAAVNATVSDIYTRLERRQGKARQGKGRGEIELKLKVKLLPRVLLWSEIVGSGWNCFAVCWLEIIGNDWEWRDCV